MYVFSVEAAVGRETATETLLLNWLKNWYSNSPSLFQSVFISDFFFFFFFLVKVKRGLDLVYGGGSVGLMGLVSQEVHRGGGHVLGYV